MIRKNVNGRKNKHRYQIANHKSKSFHLRHYRTSISKNDFSPIIKHTTHHSIIINDTNGENQTWNNKHRTKLNKYFRWTLFYHWKITENHIRCTCWHVWSKKNQKLISIEFIWSLILPNWPKQKKIKQNTNISMLSS